MTTYILTVDESEEKAIRALAEALKINFQIMSEADEDVALSFAMEKGKKYGRLSDDEAKGFLDGLGKRKFGLTGVSPK
jgi:hypothetical protein